MTYVRELRESLQARAIVLCTDAEWKLVPCNCESSEPRRNAIRIAGSLVQTSGERYFDYVAAELRGTLNGDSVKSHEQIFDSYFATNVCIELETRSLKRNSPARYNWTRGEIQSWQSGSHRVWNCGIKSGLFSCRRYTRLQGTRCLVVLARWLRPFHRVALRVSRKLLPPHYFPLLLLPLLHR